jgi:hypothetical protein
VIKPFTMIIKKGVVIVIAKGIVLLMDDHKKPPVKR